eukprot:scaffold3530_cov60-Attheya_sp.AAC.1
MKAYRALPNHLLHPVCKATAPHPNIGHMPQPTVDAGWISDSFALTDPASVLTLNTPTSSRHYRPITIR